MCGFIVLSNFIPTETPKINAIIMLNKTALKDMPTFAGFSVIF